MRNRNKTSLFKPIDNKTCIYTANTVLQNPRLLVKFRGCQGRNLLVLRPANEGAKIKYAYFIFYTHHLGQPDSKHLSEN